MINHLALESVHNSTWRGFRKPLYGSYSFAQLPVTLLECLGAQSSISTKGSANSLPRLPGDCLPGNNFDRVILILIDALGWCFVRDRLDKHPFLRRFDRDGIISPLTSQFPSTTSAHLTTLHTGLPVYESGIFEWQYYEPIAGRVIKPLLYSRVTDAQRNTLLADGLTPEKIFQWESIYQQLGKGGVKSHIFQYSQYTPSPYSDQMFAGAAVHPYDSVEGAVRSLHDAVIRERGRSLFFLYIDTVDKASHEHGPRSDIVNETINGVLTTLESGLRALWDTLSPRDLVLVTADHGQATVDASRTVYVDQVIPGISDLLIHDNDEVRAPAGNVRDLTLYPKPGARDELIQRLQGVVGEEILVVSRSELIEAGIFGTAPSTRFLDRYGEVVCLPRGQSNAWWLGDGRYRYKFQGDHGAMTPDEMETQLLALHG